MKKILINYRSNKETLKAIEYFAVNFGSIVLTIHRETCKTTRCDSYKSRCVFETFTHMDSSKPTNMQTNKQRDHQTNTHTYTYTNNMYI